MTMIAVVNDDTTFLSLMTEVLEDRGWSARVVRESDKAFTTIKDLQPAVVVLDVRMESPEAGWTILELLTLDPQTAHIPVIVCSAALMDLESKESWLNDHGISVLPKPFDIDDLYNSVDNALAAVGTAPDRKED